jgi:hypothetical protein
MIEINVALINNIRYCKFPEGITCITDFIKFLNENYHSFVELECLIEEGCVAPFFIEEDLKIEKLYWNPSHIRLVKAGVAYILPRDEYEAQLKKVIQEKCVHCINFGAVLCEQDHKPHIEHIDLNGECYGYAKNR